MRDFTFKRKSLALPAEAHDLSKISDTQPWQPRLGSGKLRQCGQKQYLNSFMGTSLAKKRGAQGPTIAVLAKVWVRNEQRTSGNYPNGAKGQSEKRCFLECSSTISGELWSEGCSQEWEDMNFGPDVLYTSFHSRDVPVSMGPGWFVLFSQHGGKH